MVENKLTETEQAASRCKDIAFGCEKCSSLLAFVDEETRSEIRVKNRDLYIYVLSPQQFKISCRGCGHMNTLSYVDNESIGRG